MCERWGKGLLAGGSPRQVVNDWLREAMKRFEKAEKMSPPGNDEAVLRWNACARLVDRHEAREPRRKEPDDSIFVDEIPPA